MLNLYQRYNWKLILREFVPHVKAFIIIATILVIGALIYATQEAKADMLSAEENLLDCLNNGCKFKAQDHTGNVSYTIVQKPESIEVGIFPKEDKWKSFSAAQSESPDLLTSM